MTRAIGYLRTSTEEQENSLAVQRDRIEGYCSLYGIELVDVVEERASGGSMEDRPELSRALARLQAGEAETIIVASFDRLTRSVRDIGELCFRYFDPPRRGREQWTVVGLISVGEQVDTRTAAGRLVLNLLVSISQWERERIVERIKETMALKRKRGEPLSGVAPWGYRKVGRELLPNVEEQMMVEKARRLHDQGFSMKEVAMTLGMDGYRTRSGGPPHRRTVSRMLRARTA